MNNIDPNRGQAKEPRASKSYKVPYMELGQAVKIKCVSGGWHARMGVVKGTIVFLNENHVTIKGDLYSSSFTLEQFKRGEVWLL
jgi:hypothetical protein